MGALRGTRIVFVVAGEVFGGAERGALDLAEIARNEGASVAILALDDRPGRGRDVAARRGLPWSSAPVPWSGGWVSKGRSLGEAARALRRLGPDAIVAGTNLPNVVTGLTWRAAGARTAVWRQCDVNGTTRFSDRLFRRALRATPVVVAGAEHARGWMTSRYGLDAGAVEVIPSVVRLPPAREPRTVWRARLGLADGAFVCCMVAHLHRGKDHDTLLRAWRDVVAELDGAGATLLLAGRDAGAEAQAKALAFDLALGERVRFLGVVDDVTGLLDACDLAVLCSHLELLPRGVTEPMTAALPVVATDLPGTREALGVADSGVLVPLGDPQSLGTAILGFARDPELRQRVGAANAATMRERDVRLSPERAWTQLLVTALGNGRT
jgi:glycosyltransferase involved in cell wall biosynthesis